MIFNLEIMILKEHKNSNKKIQKDYLGLKLSKNIKYKL